MWLALESLERGIRRQLPGRLNLKGQWLKAGHKLLLLLVCRFFRQSLCLGGPGCPVILDAVYYPAGHILLPLAVFIGILQVRVNPLSPILLNQHSARLGSNLILAKPAKMLHFFLVLGLWLLLSGFKINFFLGIFFRGSKDIFFFYPHP